MGFDQFHEPPDELTQETRTYVRVIQSLIEEAEAIDWYTQRLDVEQDEEARAARSWVRRKRKNSSILGLTWSFYYGVRRSGARP
jgi:hypothetical protein